MPARDQSIRAPGDRLAKCLLTAAATIGLALALASGASAADSLYWSNFNVDSLGFVALDTSTAGSVGTAGATLNNPVGVAIDSAAGRIYWSNSSGGKISFANLNGTGGADLATTGATTMSPGGVAIDPVGGRIYWANQGGPSYKISYANLNGTGGGDLVTTGATVNSPLGVAIDPAAGRIYWTNIGNGVISYAKLDGSGGADVPTLAAPVSSPAFVALLKAPVAATPPTITGDPTTGSTLSCSQGTWAPDLLGSSLYRVPQSFSYQWVRNGADVSGSVGSTFLTPAPGNYACRVTAANQAGASSQTSASSAVTDPPSQPPPPTPPADNKFEVGKTSLNKTKGTATIAVTVPGPGDLTLAGKDVAAQKTPARATPRPARKPVSAGTTKLTVKAKGKARKKLKSKGKVKVKVTITFTPAGGTASAQDQSVKLKKTR
jgi:hypothetical protein